MSNHEAMRPSQGGSAAVGLPFGAGEGPYLAAQDAIHANESARRYDSKMRLALVDERPLTRASFSTMLQTSGPEFTVSSFSSVAELLSAFASNASKLELVVLSIGAANVSDHKVREHIQQTRGALADVPVVVLSDCEDTACIRQTLRYGVRGYLPTTLNPAVVIEGLRVVRAGGTFVPADLMLKGFDDQPSTVVETHPNSVKPSTLAGLTPRQREVLECLRQAKSNKEIACELQLQENTVKIHVRHILQRLKVANRTRAALLASHMRLS
jgi:DNA-binding NarL/FixJ family response regulator